MPSLVLCIVLGSCAGASSDVAPAPVGTTLPSTSYFVDSIAGDDSNSGTSMAAPWKTLNKIDATTFSPGDAVLLKSGSLWTGQLWPKGSGTRLHPILIGKYGGEVKPVINGTGQADAALLLKNQEFWEVSELEITNTGPSAAVRRGVRVVAENYGEMHHI